MIKNRRGVAVFAVSALFSGVSFAGAVVTSIQPDVRTDVQGVCRDHGGFDCSRPRCFSEKLGKYIDCEESRPRYQLTTDLGVKTKAFSRDLADGKLDNVAEGLNGLFNGGLVKSQGDSSVSASAGSWGEEKRVLTPFRPRDSSRKGWIHLVPGFEAGSREDSKGASVHTVGTPSRVLGGVVAIEKGLEQNMEKAAKIVEAEGERRARDGAIKQREAEKKWEGKARNYPQYGN